MDSRPDPATGDYSHPDRRPREADAEWARSLHDRTHEVELLISGAVLFGLLQLPPRLDAWFDMMSIRLAGEWWFAVYMVWVYVRLIVATLILSFGVHLVARAYWVGLVGLDSAFPRGVRWDNVKYGPITLDTYRDMFAPVPTMARRVDVFCSSIYAFAFIMVVVFGLSVVVALIAGAVALGLSAVLPGLSYGWVFAGVVVLAVGLPSLATAIDKAWAGRIDPGGRLGRAIRNALRRSQKVLGGHFYLPIQLTLFSNLPRTIMWPVYGGMFLLLFVGLTGGIILRSGILTVSPTGYFPTRPGARSVDTRYFATTRDPLGTAPFIPAEVVEGPYVRLEIPFVARRDVERIEAACEGAPALGREGLVQARVRRDPPDPGDLAAVLACLGGLYDVRMDGTPVEPAWDFLSRPGVGVTSLVAWLPARDLEPGPHVLSIEEVLPGAEGARATGDGGSADGGAEVEAPRHHLIRFRR